MAGGGAGRALLRGARLLILAAAAASAGAVAAAAADAAALEAGSAAGVAPAADGLAAPPGDFDDECGEGGGGGGEGEAACALSALQRRAGPRSSVAPDADAPLQGEGLEDYSVDDARVLVEAAAAADDNLCNGTAYDISSEGCCGGKAVYSYTTQGCCGGSAVYSFATEGCCNNEAVFSLARSAGCVPPAKKPGSSSGGSAAATPPPSSSFKCKAEWPTPRARAGWSYYCGMKPPKVWAMNADCTYAWYSVKDATKEAAEKTALASCAKGGRGNCTVFDLNGNVCGEHAQTRYCSGVAYDISRQGCCGGRVYPYGTYDCCGGAHIFKRSSQGCCAGTVFDNHVYGCCGGRQLFVASTHGCCLNDGLQIYEMGAQNCCAQPRGVCTIPEGYYSCCR